MHAQNEVEGAEHVVGGDNVREGLVQVELLDAELLDVPARTPNIGRVGNAEGRVGGLLLFHGGEVTADSLAKVAGESVVVERRGDGSDGPRNFGGVGDDIRAGVQDLLAVGFAAGSLPDRKSTRLNSSHLG